MALDGICGFILFFTALGIWGDLMTRDDRPRTQSPFSLLRLLAGKK